MRNDAATWEELSRRGFDNVVDLPRPRERPSDPGTSGSAPTRSRPPTSRSSASASGTRASRRSTAVWSPARRTRYTGGSAPVFHDESPLFAGIPQGFGAVRYHSLRVDAVPAVVRRSAWTADGTVMGLSHRERPHWGVQFHPESICTEHGRRLLENFRDLSRLVARSRRPRARRAPAGARAGRRPAARRCSGGASTGSSIRRPRSCGSTASGASRTGSTAASSRTGCRASPTSARAAGPLSRVVSYDAARRRVRARDADVRPHARREHLQLSRARAGRPGLRRRGRAVRPRGRLRRLLRLRGQGGLRIAAAPPLAVAGRAVHPVRSADRLRPPRGPHLRRLSRAQRGRRPPLAGADGARAARRSRRCPPRPARPPRRSSSRPGASARATSTTSPHASARSPPGRATRSASPTSSAAAPGSIRCRCTASCAGAIRRRTPPTCGSAT